ncbi:MAG: tail fiber domain-containing protein [Sphingomonas pseudosanguinis]|uniref:tail fiber domain-containing protein n=1 Tax=Sphingomonas pseudosanguinis TaxID=413712 RepID=UPI003918D8A5
MWNRAGTVTVTNGSAVVTGNGTNFSFPNAQPGQAFIGPNGLPMEILSVDSATQLTLAVPYTGATANGQPFSILPTASFANDLALAFSGFKNLYGGLLDTIGQGMFPDGAAAAPGIRFAVDQDTGIGRNGENTLVLVAGGAARAKISEAGIDVSGRVIAAAPDTIGVAKPTLGQLPVGVSSFLTNANRGYGLLIGHHGTTGNTWMQAQRIDGDARAYDLLLQPSGGNLGVGTENPASRLHIKSSPANALTIENTAVRGAGGVFLDFRDAGGRKGYAGYAGSDDTLFLLNQTNAGLTLGCNDFQWLRIEADGLVRPGADNAQSLGTSAFRWGSIFAVNGTIQTSDQRSKQEISAIPEAWLDAWADVEWCRFKFIDAVAAKDDGARWHLGLIAQQVRDAFAGHGLDAQEIGLLCYDEWEATSGIPAHDEERDADGNIVKYALPGQPARPAGDRWGLRYDECQAIEAAYQRRRIAQLEAAIGALSAQRG